MKKQFIFIIAGIFVLSQFGLSDIPRTINYQGRFLTTDGVPVLGVIGMTFRLYSAESGGDLLWAEQQETELNNGYFNVRLGISTAFPSTLFDNPVFLEMEGVGEIMTPRQCINSAPYALVASKALMVPSGAVLGNSIVTTDSIAVRAVITAAIADNAVTSLLKQIQPGPFSVVDGANQDLINLPINLAYRCDCHSHCAGNDNLGICIAK